MVQIVEEHRKRVIQYEDKLLSAIRFNFSLTHPHQCLLKLGKLLKESEDNMKTAFTYLQRLYMTSIILHYPPHYLALVALIEARIGRSVSEELKWAQAMNINKVDLADIQDKLTKFWALIKN